MCYISVDVFVSISDKSQQLGSMQRSEQLIAMNQHNMQYGFNAQPYEGNDQDVCVGVISTSTYVHYNYCI